MDKLSTARRSENMRRIRSEGTRPEIKVRKMLHRIGYRFRVHVKDLPGKPDVVFTRKRRIILVHGCFWHQHPDSGCLGARLPKTRIDYWIPKLARNQERDASVISALTDAGWSVLVVWECEVDRDPNLLSKLAAFIGPAK